MQTPISIVLASFFFVVGGVSGCADPCDACDPDTEYCQVYEGCGFLQSGNPNPLGEPDRATCQPLPEACLDDVRCSCLVCGEGATPEDCRGAFGFCSEDDVVLRETFGCE